MPLSPMEIFALISMELLCSGIIIILRSGIFSAQFVFVLVQLSMVMLPSISFLSWASAPGDTAASTYLSVLLGYESYRHYLMIMSCFGTFSCEVAFHQVTQYGILDLI